MRIVKKFTNQKCVGYTKDLVAIVESHVIFTDGTTGVVWQVGLGSEVTDVRPYIHRSILKNPNLTPTPDAATI